MLNLKTTGGNREHRAQLLDAIVIGSKNSQQLPKLNQVAFLVIHFIEWYSFISQYSGIKNHGWNQESRRTEI